MNKLSQLALLLALPLSIVACGDDMDTDTDEDTDTEETDTDTNGDTETDDGDDDTNDDDDDVAPTTASIRVMHLSPDAPAVDIYAEGVPTPVISALAFEEGTAYLELPGGTYTLYIVGATDEPVEDPAGSAAYTIDSLTIDNGVSYTAVAHGYLTGDDANFTVSALVDDRDDIDSGDIRVQVFHGAAAGAFAQVDVWNVTGDPSALIPDFDYAADVTTDLPIAAYDLCLDVDNNSECDATFGIPELATGFYNVYAVNDSDGNPFLLAHVDDEDGTIVRLDPVVAE